MGVDKKKNVKVESKDSKKQVKPAELVLKPKFKVGDIVVCKDREFARIYKIDGVSFKNDSIVYHTDYSSEYKESELTILDSQDDINSYLIQKLNDNKEDVDYELRNNYATRGRVYGSIAWTIWVIGLFAAFVCALNNPTADWSINLGLSSAVAFVLTLLYTFSN